MIQHFFETSKPLLDDAVGVISDVARMLHFVKASYPYLKMCRDSWHFVFHSVLLFKKRVVC